MQDPSSDIREVVRILLSGRTAERQKVVDTCFTSDAVFVHPLLTLRGRREVFDLYQYWHDWNARLAFRLPKVVVSSSKDRLVLDVDEFITPFTVPIWSPVLRLIVFLDLQKTPQGYKISRQEDHILWAESVLLNVPWLGRLWQDQGRRAVGITICYTTRGIGRVMQLFSKYVVPYIPYADNWTSLQSKLRDIDQVLDSKLPQKWDAELT